MVLMKQINYENLEEDAHVCHMWEPLNFKIKDNYNFIPKNNLLKLISNILIIPIGILLTIINKILFGFEIKNKEELINDSGFISISNHIHPMDCTMIGLIYFPRRVYYPTIQRNFKIPFIRHLIRFLYAIPIPTEDKQKKKFYSEINAVLKDGKILQMYPEGSLWPYYEKIRSFKYGAFKMAAQANVPIQPIKFVFKEPEGIYKLYKKKKCIHAIVLDPIYPDDNLEYKEKIADLHNKAVEIMNKEN